MSDTVLDMNTPELAELMAAFSATVEPYERARAARLDAEVGVVRGLLIALANNYPFIEGYEFEESSEYNDEGGYYTVITGFVACASGVTVLPADKVDDELAEICSQWITEEILERIGHTVTVAQLRAT